MPEPAPEIIMAANGIYWRRYEDSLSMVPTSTDNDPVLTPYAVYRIVGHEDHEGNFTPVDPASVPMSTLAKVATVAEQMRRRAEAAEAAYGERFNDGPM